MQDFICYCLVFFKRRGSQRYISTELPWQIFSSIIFVNSVEHYWIDKTEKVVGVEQTGDRLLLCGCCLFAYAAYSGNKKLKYYLF